MKRLVNVKYIITLVPRTIEQKKMVGYDPVFLKG